MVCDRCGGGYDVEENWEGRGEDLCVFCRRDIENAESKETTYLDEGY